MLSVKAEPSLTSMNEDDDGDEDDGDDDGSTPRGEFSTADFSIDSSTDRKKRVHLKCEQQRREAIKTGYAELKEMLPSDFAPLGYKMTNAAILFRTVDYIQKLQQTDRQQSEELVKLRSQLSALQIICQNYENLVSQQGSKSAGAKESACAQQNFKVCSIVASSHSTEVYKPIRTHRSPARYSHGSRKKPISTCFPPQSLRTRRAASTRSTYSFCCHRIYAVVLVQA